MRDWEAQTLKTVDFIGSKGFIGLVSIRSQNVNLLTPRREGRFAWVKNAKRSANIGISFEGDALTHFGGLFLIQRFCNQLRLRRRLQRILKSAPHWVDYRPEDLILTFLYVLVAGIQRVNKTDASPFSSAFAPAGHPGVCSVA